MCCCGWAERWVAARAWGFSPPGVVSLPRVDTFLPPLLMQAAMNNPAVVASLRACVGQPCVAAAAEALQSGTAVALNANVRREWWC